MDLLSKILNVDPRPGLHPIPGTTPLTLEAMLCPPLIYYLALLFLPPAPPPAIDSQAVKVLRNVLALLAAFLFFRLPLTYHVPQSIGLTYQLGLVGLYGGARVVDAFFISPYMFGHIPRRVVYKHESRVGTPLFEGLKDLKAQSSTSCSSSSPPQGIPSNKSSSLSSSSSAAAAATSSAFEKITTTDHPPPDTTATREPPPAPSKKAKQPTTSSNATDLVLDNIALPDGLSTTSSSSSYFNLLTGPSPKPVLEHTIPEDGWPHTFSDRASWALELELSMRGVGFTWSTADVRHTRKTWLPTVHNRLHSIFVHDVPTLAVCFVVVRSIYLRYGLGDDVVSEVFWDDVRANNFHGNGYGHGYGGVVGGGDAAGGAHHHHHHHLFDTRLPFGAQLVLTGCLGAFLMAAFALAHSAGAVLMSPLAPHPLAYFPPLYTLRIWEVTSVRAFWSYGWHRLFARFFLVYGIWPGEWVERKLRGRGKKAGEEEGPIRADVGKVLGAFVSSGFCHSFAVRGVLGGDWWLARGEMVFFVVNGLAVVVEEGVKRVVIQWRKTRGQAKEQWWDGLVGRIWWICVLLVSGRSFARGWVDAGLVREMSGF